MDKAERIRRAAAADAEARRVDASRPKWNKHGGTYPHEGGCEGCHAERRCNVCGSDIRKDRGRCTNGRCTTCHVAVCTPGGDTSPGHGFGSLNQAVARAAEVSNA